ncbi:efflux transporter outer membrane subunit [Collimonas sp.]|jgi:NodT family efflux transporter outer membrane factor (OMF) lipoprotein|uniref:efflux transporter outer membrane subunit n=1 Tax=Collimonas sp. TaxID=1963772 RepID=UPI002C138436|nr:efflux transporter outer membrane subunit [Collimonas sp.]HWW05120.1 efflux transporter outer membrane subunit [Collimonas sp.]
MTAVNFSRSSRSSRSLTGRRVFNACLAVSLLAMGGCAQIPELGVAPTLKPVEQLASAKSFSSAPVTWPGDHWWEAYGDPQLNALVEEALRGSPNLELAQARLRTAEAAVQGAGAPLMPEVTANASLAEAKQSYNYLMPKAAVPQGGKDYGQATLNLSWELDFWGKNRSALAGAISEQRAAEAEVAQTRLILSTSVASAYAELVHLFAVRDTAEASLTLRTKTVALFHQRNENGLENLASVRQVEARQAAAQAELLGVDERIALLRNGMAALLGDGPDRGLAIIRPTVQFTGGAGLPSNLSLELLGRRPDIVAARLRTEAAAKRIDQQKAGFYPSINLMAFVGVQSLGIDKMIKSGSGIGSVGPAISLPIFNTQGLQAQLRGARAEYDASVSIYNATLSNALREVADAATSRKALDGELAASRAAVAAAVDAYDIVDKRYKGALATYLDVLSAEDALVSAQRSLADVETRAVVLNVALVRALGGGYQNPEKQSSGKLGITG